MIIMNKDVLERSLHLNMAMIGGFLGGYAILNYHDLFGSAQTSNMIALALDAAGRSDGQWPFRILALVVYITGFVVTVILSHKISDLNLKRISIILDGIVLLVVSFYPEDINSFVALYPMFFATAFQWCSFRGADGFVSSTIFSTNNLRQCTTGFAEYMCSRDKEALRRGVFFGRVLLFYHIGVMGAFLSCMKFDLKGSWIGLLPVLTAFVLCNYDTITEYFHKKNDIPGTSV